LIPDANRVLEIGNRDSSPDLARTTRPTGPAHRNSPGPAGCQSIFLVKEWPQGLPNRYGSVKPTTL